jgi:DNA polymerase III sliding clamp (beta) subunit (PCNA family)
MIVNREALLLKLELLLPGLSKSEVIDQSNCFVFTNKEIVTFNDEVACRLPSPLTNMTGVVLADPFVKLIRKLPDERIKVEINDDGLVIQDKFRHKTAVVRMEAEVTIPVESIESPGEWSPLPDEFDDGVSLVASCAGHDEARFILTCVHIHPNWVEASDNMRLCRYKMKTGLSQSSVIRAEALKQIVGTGMCEFSETFNWVHFRNKSGLVMSFRRYMDPFPELSRFLEVNGSITELPKGIEESLDRCEIFSSDAGNNEVKVSLTDNLIVLEGRGASGWYRERRPSRFVGEPVSFMVVSSLLKEIVKRFETCIVAPGILKVEDSKFSYVTCTGEVV